jgi:hypothetical protein
MAPGVSVAEIEERSRRLPPEKLVVVLDFVSYLLDRELSLDPFSTALASEAVLARDWDRPEEDAAWQHL